MFTGTPRRDAVRVRLIAAATALGAALLVAAAALALVLGARRRAEEEMDRAASDLATSSARIILEESVNFALDATDLIGYAVDRGRYAAAIPPDSLLRRLVWSQRMAIGDARYVDSANVAFVRASAGADWRWSGASDTALRARLADVVRERVARAAPSATLLGATFPWHGRNMAAWILLDHDATGAPNVVEGVAFSRTAFLARFIPQVLATVPVLPASVGGSRWSVADTGRMLAVPGRDLSVRMEDLGTHLVEFDTGPLPKEGAHGSYEFGAPPGHVIRVRVGLADAVASALVSRASTTPPEWSLWLLLSIALLLAVFSGIVTTRAFASLAQRQRFLAAVSHELRTPLTQVRLSVETLAHSGAGDARRARALESLGRGTEQLTRTVENLLTLAKADLATWTVRPRPTELGALVRATVESMTPIAAARRVVFDVVAPSPAWASVDPDAFRQVILNLLDNALKHGPPDSSVRVRLSATDGRVTLAVGDRGPGVPASERERIWRAFERLDHPDRRPDGLGLGLSVVKDIIGGHGGTARVEEGEGGGALFIIDVPALSSADAFAVGSALSVT